MNQRNLVSLASILCGIGIGPFNFNLKPLRPAYLPCEKCGKPTRSRAEETKLQGMTFETVLVPKCFSCQTA